MFNSSGAGYPRGLLIPHPSAPRLAFSLLSAAPSAPTSGSATGENRRNNTAFVQRSALGLLLNKCSEEEFWWLALPLAQADPTVSDFINTLWGDQKNKSSFIGSYMVTELFPHQLKFAFLSPCHHVDYLFCSCSRKRNVLSPRAQTSLGRCRLCKGWSYVGMTAWFMPRSLPLICNWWCDIIYKVVTGPLP